MERGCPGVSPSPPADCLRLSVPRSRPTTPSAPPSTPPSRPPATRTPPQPTPPAEPRPRPDPACHPGGAPKPRALSGLPGAGVSGVLTCGVMGAMGQSPLGPSPGSPAALPAVLGGPTEGPPVLPPSHLQGKGPGQGPIFAAFEPIILSPARCVTSAGTGGLRVYLRSPNRNKGSLGIGGTPLAPPGHAAAGGTGSP